MAAQIEHPNVIPVHEVDEHDGLLFISMRYVDGSDLRGVISSAGRLPPRRAVRIVGQVADALDAAHAHGLVHRDIKPASILVTGPPEREHAYLTDSGLTKQMSAESGFTKTGMFVGTLDYIAPEQLQGKPVDARAGAGARGDLPRDHLGGGAAQALSPTARCATSSSPGARHAAAPAPEGRGCSRSSSARCRPRRRISRTMEPS